MAAQVFENGVFLFFTHPFDVGDIIKFEDNRYEVKAINLQYVNLEYVLGQDVNVPTTEMRDARLINITRCAQVHFRRVCAHICKWSGSL
jgi:small-conductance mechanosensitive channel